MDSDTPPIAQAATNDAGDQPIATTLSGAALLGNPRLNKGSAFPEDERAAFHLHGLLPPAVMSIERQLIRTYESYRVKTTDLE
ncbi:MAG: hypothetical protein KGO05_04845, partial [Chloroflexota bacterium]|nr:hypothetical protein [Chloroflexota bacterium]